jgi:peptidoglycan/LPS O-acetylase OafA/YrhL
MPNASKDTSPPPARYEGIDAFRVVGIYVVVLVHFQYEWVPEMSLGPLLRLLGCAFPFVILASFFVLARSVLGKPERGFRRFFAARFKRIEIPFLIWTVVYWWVMSVFYPLVKGEAVTWPSATLLLGGYRHLWFLQFIFLGSLILYPLLHFYARRGRYRWQIAVACLVVLLTHVLWLRPIFEHLQAVSVDDTGAYIRPLFGQAIRYFAYVPAALGIALYADEISAFYRRRAGRALALAFAALTLIIHLLNDSLPFTKGIYSLAVFVAFLQPLPAGLVNFLRPIAIFSYPIYILHLWVVRVVISIFYRAQVEPTLASVLTGGVIVFGLSLLAAFVLRRLCPWDWFLPLIPIKRRGRDVESVRQPDVLPLVMKPAPPNN